MVKQPQALPLRLSRSFWASITKSEPHRMKHSIGPPDLAIDPHNSQIKSIRPVSPTHIRKGVSKASQIKSRRLSGDFGRSFLHPTPCLLSSLTKSPHPHTSARKYGFSKA